MAGRATTPEKEALRRSRIAAKRHGQQHTASTRAKISATMTEHGTRSLLHRAASRHMEDI
jgi:hypothetical protein